MISRVAEHCFWFGRYLDRAESAARLLQVTRALVFDADVPVTQCWQPLVIVSGAYPEMVARHGAAATGNGEAVQSFLVWNRENPASLYHSVQAGRASARVIRDALSLEIWEEMNELFHWLGSQSAVGLYREDREAFYDRIRKSTQLVLGLVRSTMLHDTPMSFLWMGVMLERAGQIARILDIHHHTMEREQQGTHEIVEMAMWLSLLKACSGHEAFMRKHQGLVSPAEVASFLFFDDQFPRSLRYCVRSARRILDDIWPPAEDRAPRGSRSRLDGLIAWIDEQNRALAPGRIHELLTHVVDETALACSHIETEIAGPTPSANMTRA